MDMTKHQTASWKFLSVSTVLLIIGYLNEPFKPRYQHAYSPYCYPYISIINSWENLIKHGDIFSLVMNSFILMNCMFGRVLVL